VDHHAAGRLTGLTAAVASQPQWWLENYSL